jgi:PAS domain-containing protein
MWPFLSIVALSIGLVAALGGWRRARKRLSESQKRSQDRDAEGTSVLKRANEVLKASQEDLQRRWQYLAEAQKLSRSGTFAWNVQSGELVWSDETYRILGFARETNPTLDLVFDRVHPEDRDRLQQFRDRATKSGIDLDIEYRVLLPDGIITSMSSHMPEETTLATGIPLSSPRGGTTCNGTRRGGIAWTR